MPERGGAEHHPLLVAERGKAVVEQLRALLAPVAAPVAAGAVRAVAVEAGEDVEGVDSGHVVPLECWRPPPAASHVFYERLAPDPTGCRQKTSRHRSARDAPLCRTARG